MFHGVRVVELAQWVFVPACGMVLAELGADVVKIEHPETGDAYRGLTTRGIGSTVDDINLNWEQNNRGKRSVALDIRQAKGREALYRLIANADVFLTNFRPDVLDRLGYGIDTLREHNPSLIYARGSGFGVRGAEAGTAAYDSTAYWARGGLAHTLTPADYDGEIASRGAIGDKPCAMNLAFGVAAALFRRATTGHGCIVDTSLLAGAVWTISSDILSAAHRPTQEDPTIKPNRRLEGYRTSDGRLIVLQFLNDAHWSPFMRAIGRADLVNDPRFSTRDARLANTEAYEAEIKKTFAARTYVEWCTTLRQHPGPWAPVQSAGEVVDDPQVVANSYLPVCTSHEGTVYRLAAIPTEFDETPITPGRAPDVGEHTEEVLLELGYSWDEIIDLKIANVVR